MSVSNMPTPPPATEAVPISKHPWLIGIFTALFCICGFPFFGYRLVREVTRGLVVHILFWLVNLLCVVATVVLLVLLITKGNSTLSLSDFKLLFFLILALPFIGFLSTVYFCVRDTVRISLRHRGASFK
jgi:hypothetical protein